MNNPLEIAALAERVIRGESSDELYNALLCLLPQDRNAFSLWDILHHEDLNTVWHLHKVKLEGWAWSLTDTPRGLMECHVYDNRVQPNLYARATAISPVRAWLAAILRALSVLEQNKGVNSRANLEI